MNISLDPKKIISIAGHSINVVLWAVLFVVLILAGLVVNQSVTIVRNSQQVVLVPKTSQVRVNFGLYDQILKRLEQQSSFQPTPVTTRNPFGIVETPARNVP